MALRQKDGEIPKDAIILSEQDARIYQWKIIEKWEPRSDIWALKYGTGILAGLSVLSSIYINNHYRRKLRLGRYGHLSTYLPNVAVPAFMAALIHNQSVTERLLLEPTSCPVCLQTRAAAFQALLVTVYPIILSPLSNFMFASRYGTYRLPYHTDVMSNLKTWQKLTRPIGKILSIMFITQGFAAATVTYLEAKSVYTIQEKMLLAEAEYDRKMSEI